MGSDFNGIQSASELQSAFEMGRSMNQLPTKRLTVSEVERLAKAGVTVTLSQIDIVPEALPYFPEQRHLMEPLIHRLRLAFPAHAFADHRFSHLSAAPSGEADMKKVAVTVVTVNGNAALLEDDYKSFPSEALMAKIHLLLETETKRPATIKSLDAMQTMSPPPQVAPNSLLAGALGRFKTP